MRIREIFGMASSLGLVCAAERGRYPLYVCMYVCVWMLDMHAPWMNKAKSLGLLSTFSWMPSCLTAPLAVAWRIRRDVCWKRQAALIHKVSCGRFVRSLDLRNYARVDSFTCGWFCGCVVVWWCDCVGESVWCLRCVWGVSFNYNASLTWPKQHQAVIIQLA